MEDVLAKGWSLLADVEVRILKEDDPNKLKELRQERLFIINILRILSGKQRLES